MHTFSSPIAEATYEITTNRFRPVNNYLLFIIFIILDLNTAVVLLKCVATKLDEFQSATISLL